MVSTSLVRVLTSLVMVSTSLGMVGTPEALLWGPQRRLLHRRATRDWKSESVTDGWTLLIFEEEKNVFLVHPLVIELRPLFRHASVSSTYPCIVRWLVR